MPAANLEALVGHLFVVGGRSISSASPGAIAMAAPRRAARGRDADTMFGLLSLSAEQRQPASFYEQLTGDLSGKYFSTTGSLTAALREAIGAVNGSLHRSQAGQAQPPSIGLACAILREQELILAVVGPARCLIFHAGSLERLPADEEVAEGMRSLGADGEPDIRLYRREIQADDFVLLCDSSLNEAQDLAIQRALGDGQVDVALNNLRDIAGQFASAEVVKFVAPIDEPAPAEVAQPAAPEPEAPAPRTPAGGRTPTNPRPLGEEAPTGHAPHLPMPRRAGRRAALNLAQVVSGTQTLVGKMMPDLNTENPLEERYQMPISTQIGVAVGVAILVALITTVVYVFAGKSSEYTQLVNEAVRQVQQAQAGGNDQATARPHWETALFLLDKAAEIHGLSADMAGLQGQVRDELDSYDHVTRVALTPMREYPQGTVLRGPIIQGLNLYVIDTSNDILYREDLDQNGTTFVNQAPQIIARRGDVLNSQPVGGLIDLAWMTDGGTPQKNVLAVLADNGVLVTYSPSSAVTAVGLPGFEAWQNPRAIAIYNRDLYILDAGANEIWRYQAGPDSYPSLPQRYFTEATPHLSDAIDMKIDANGNVYVLHSTGQIDKYYFGRQQTFSFIGLPQPLAQPSAMTLNLNLVDRVFYLADKGGARLYTTALNGEFLSNFKDTDGTIFTSISGVASQDQPPLVYVAAGNRLYYFPRPQ